MTSRVLLSFFVLVFALRAAAQATFGSEFTFTNSLIRGAQQGSHYVNNDESERHRDLMGARALATCDGCRLVNETNAYGVKVVKVVYPDGFHFTIATDPAVVEVQMKPVTNEEIAKNLHRIRRDIFGAAEFVGMKPDARVGGGHLHIGWLSATGGDLLLLRNFIVDFANHPGIASGLLAYDHFNSPPIQALPEDRQRAFRRIIMEVDSGLITTVAELARRIQTEVYNWNQANWNPPHKYHALNLVRIADNSWREPDKTFEIRSIRAQMSAEEFQMLTRLFEGRIEYLRHLGKPVPLRIPREQTPEQAFRQFSNYVARSGIRFAEFREVFRFYDAEIADATPSPKPVFLCRRVNLY